MSDDILFKILLVEDTKLHMDQIKKGIESADDHFKVETCESSDAALNHINNTPTDFVILDIQIPKVDGGKAEDEYGFKVLETIDKLHKWLPVIVFTVHPPGRYQTDALTQGVFSYIEKASNLQKQIETVIVPIIKNTWAISAKIYNEYEEKRNEYIEPFKNTALNVFKLFVHVEATAAQNYLETELIPVMQETTSVMQETTVERITSESIPCIDKSLRILDMGCGKGRFLKQLDEQSKNNSETLKNISYTGIDPSNKMIELADEICHDIEIQHKFLNCTLEDYKSKCNEKFDIIVCVNVVHEIPSKKLLNSIKCMTELLSPEGRLIITDMENLPEPEPYPVVWNRGEICDIIKCLGYSDEQYKTFPIKRTVPIWSIVINSPLNTDQNIIENKDLIKNMLHKKIMELNNSIQELGNDLGEHDPVKIRSIDGIRSFVENNEKDIRTYIIEYCKLSGYIKNWIEISDG